MPAATALESWGHTVPPRELPVKVKAGLALCLARSQEAGFTSDHNNHVMPQPCRVPLVTSLVPGVPQR